MQAAVAQVMTAASEQTRMLVPTIRRAGPGGRRQEAGMSRQLNQRHREMAGKQPAKVEPFVCPICDQPRPGDPNCPRCKLERDWFE
jgi:hypothetical protein